MLQHERLDVYNRALELLDHVRMIAVDRLPRGSRNFAQRILSASSSLVIDIASAAGHPSVGAQRRAYGAAIHAATKCGAILDVLRHLVLIGENEHLTAKKIVERIVAGLRRRVRALEGDRRVDLPRTQTPRRTAESGGETTSVPPHTTVSSDDAQPPTADELGGGVMRDRRHEPLLNAPLNGGAPMQT